MSEPEIPDDGIVQTALQLLPVPPHGDDFWTRLEHSLDAEEGPAADAAHRRPVLVPAAGRDAAPEVLELEPDHRLALVPPAFRRKSNALLVAVAVAAVVVVAFAGNTLLEQREGTDVSASGDLQPDPELETLVRDAQGGSSTPTTLSADGQEASTEAVLAWVADLGTGHDDRAWEAMGEISKAHFGSQTAFQSEMSALAEGYGAWSAADPDEVLVTPVLTDDDGAIAVVTLVGRVEQEGATQHRADAFPVRISGGKVHLEPFADAGELELVVPEVDPDDDGARPQVAASDELVIVVPGGAAAPILRLDDGEPLICGEADGTELTPLDGLPGQRCSFLPEGGISAGEHTFTAAFVGADGASVAAESVLFEAA